jgi:hypothetical protein
MLKTIGATLAVASIAAAAGQALALNPQPLPPGRIHYVVHRPVPPCPPARGFAKTCF